MEALVLEKRGLIRVRKIDGLDEEGVEPYDVRVKMHTVGICGTDVHHYKHGGIEGQHTIMDKPLVLGHEGSGVVVEVGSKVGHLRVGDRVCMETAVPAANSRALREGCYNICPQRRTWTIPPTHGCLRPYVVHPADYTFKLPDTLSFAEGALMEPFSVAVHAANRAQIRPGDIACVLGAGSIGVMCALAALASGCTRVLLCDVLEEKLSMLAKALPPTVVPCSVANGKRALLAAINELTGGWGVNVVFEASGNAKALDGVDRLLCPQGRLVLVGIMEGRVEIDLSALQFKEIIVEPIWGYYNAYPRAIELMASGKVDLKPFITRTFPFKDSVKAFDEAALLKPSDVKIQILME